MEIIIIAVIALSVIFYALEKRDKKNSEYKKQFEEITTETNYTESATKHCEQQENKKMKKEEHIIIKNLITIKRLLVIITIIAILFLIKEVFAILIFVNLPEILSEALNYTNLF